MVVFFWHGLSLLPLVVFWLLADVPLQSSTFEVLGLGGDSLLPFWRDRLVRLL
jgi:hypothetical protein